MITVSSFAQLLKNLILELGYKKYHLFFITLLFLSVTPIIDILLYKSIIDIAMEGLENNTFSTVAILEFVTVCILLLGIGGLKYYFNVKRIFFINLFTLHKKREKKLNPVGENWYRASLMELTILLISTIQVLFLIVLSLFISLEMGGILLVVIFSIYSLALKLFFVEINNQISYVKESYTSKKSLAGKKLTSRIVRAEQSRFLGSTIMNLMIVASFVLFYNGLIEVDKFVIFIFISKYVGNMLSMISSSFMRLARSLAYTKKIFLS